MKNLLLTCLVALTTCLVLTSSALPFTDQEAAGNAVNKIKWNDMFSLYYQIQVESTVEYIHFWIVTKYAGWSGIGLGSAMAGSDMIIVNTDKTEYDYFNPVGGAPGLDTAQTEAGVSDVILVKEDKVSSPKVFHLKRKTNTGDSKDKVITVGQNQDFIFASHNTSTTLSQHNSAKAILAQPISKTQICDSSCSKCSGPEPDHCTACSGEALLIGTSCQTLTKHALNTFTLDKIKLSYQIVGDDRILLHFEYNYPGWAGIGFGKGMSGGVDMLRVYMDGTTPKVEDLWSTATSRPALDTAVSGKDDWTVQSGSRSSNLTKISILRKLNTEDAKDFLITLTNLDVVFSGNTDSDAFNKHNFGGKTQINFTKENLNPPADEKSALITNICYALPIIYYFILA